jgi:hypothetical protein
MLPLEEKVAVITGGRSLQQRLVKAGGRLVKHARYYWLLLQNEAMRVYRCG